MEINLSWDLFVIVFFTVIIAYSFIVGRNSTLKIIIASYIAILASDGIGNLIEHFLIGDKPLINLLDVTTNENSLIVIKIFIFVLTIVIIATRGRFAINMEKTKSPIMNVILNLTYGVLSAGLITSTILIYASGTSLVQETATPMVSQAILQMYKSSYMVQMMINNYNLWFSLPAITFVISSFIGEEA